MEIQLEGWVSGFGERLNLSIEDTILLSLESQIDEETVRSIRSWWQDWFLCDGNEAGPLLASALSEELFNPETKG